MRKPSTSGRLAFACAVILWSTAVAAQPSILSNSGQWSHKATVTISGTGFGTKSTAAPSVWDDASGFDVSAKWDGAWPNCAANDAYNLAYRTPSEVGRNIALPHDHITRYIAGAHDGPAPGPQCSYNVIMWKVRTITSFQAYSYVSWYQRSDDGWHFGDSDNYKTFAYSEGVGPYSLPNNWYMEYNPRPTSRTSGATWHLNDDAFGTAAQSLQSPDQNGHNLYWDNAVNPMAGQWSKIEMELKYTNQNDGYIKLWENGVLRADYRGRTDGLAGSTRTEGIGGYAVNYPYASNWRYFADVYLDSSRARVILGDAPTLDASTIREVQIPTQWSDSSIDVTVNLGRFGDRQTAYLYVVTQDGAVNAAGVPIATVPGWVADTTAPTVSVLNPTGGSVSGMVSVEVAASDNESVAGVQLLIDGVETEHQDTTAPYAIDWNSAMSVNGVHQITARARDAAGNVAISAPVIVTTDNASAPTTTGLVASYSFDQGRGLILRDDSGHGHDGTLPGDATWTADGRNGAALWFDGVDDMVVIPNDETLNVRTGFTIEARVNPSALSGYRNVILKGRPAPGGAAGGLSYGLYVNNNTPNPAATINTGGADLTAPGISAVPINTWTHLAATYDGATLNLFVNGVLTGSRAASGLLAISADALTLGGNDIWGEFFAGAIDDVRIYNRALSGAEIAVDVGTPVIAPTADTTLGPITYQGTGVRKATFDVTDVTATYAMLVTSVGVQDGLVLLNDRVAFRPRDPHRAIAEVPIRPRRGSNTVVTAFIGARGSSMTVEIVRRPGRVPPPPHVTITSPSPTAVLTEGATIPITAAASGTAVRRVDLLVNGVVMASEEMTAPRFLFTVPFGVNWLNLQARVTDAAGRTASTADMIVTVVPDLLTTVRGRVEDTAGRRIAAADVGAMLPGLSAEIFTFNGTLAALPNLSGRTPAVVKLISAANLRNPNGVFGDDPFGFGPRSHAIRLTGSLQVTRAGVYSFVLGVNAGGRLTVGGATIINAAQGTGAFQQLAGKVWLPAGSIPIEVRTFDNGNPQIQLSYAPPGRDLTVIPQRVLTPAFTPYRARSGTLGAFSIAGVPTALGDLEVGASSAAGRGRTLTGDTGPVAPVAAGVTDIGVVRVH